MASRDSAGNGCDGSTVALSAVDAAERVWTGYSSLFSLLKRNYKDWEMRSLAAPFALARAAALKQSDKQLRALSLKTYCNPANSDELVRETRSFINVFETATNEIEAGLSELAGLHSPPRHDTVYPGESATRGAWTAARALWSALRPEVDGKDDVEWVMPVVRVLFLHYAYATPSNLEQVMSGLRGERGRLEAGRAAVGVQQAAGATLKTKRARGPYYTDSDGTKAKIVAKFMELLRKNAKATSPRRITIKQLANAVALPNSTVGDYLKGDIRGGPVGGDLVKQLWCHYQRLRAAHAGGEGEVASAVLKGLPKLKARIRDSDNFGCPDEPDAPLK